jgi:allantoinase
LFQRHQLPVTVYGIAMAMERNPDVVSAMLEANWEIASHGYRWIDYQFVSEETEREHMTKAIDIHERLTGSKPLGWYTGRDSPNTRKLVLEHDHFLYDSDSYADDLPYWHQHQGGNHLVIPYTLDNNDMKFVAPQGFNAGDQFYTYLKDSFDILYAEGGRMMNVGLHCRVVGKPGRAASLERFLEYVATKPDVWITRRMDIANHWHQHHQTV